MTKAMLLILIALAASLAPGCVRSYDLITRTTTTIAWTESCGRTVTGPLAGPWVCSR